MQEDQANWNEAEEFYELKDFVRDKKVEASPKKQSRSGSSYYWKYVLLIIFLVGMIVGFYAYRAYQTHNRQLQRDVKQYQMQQEYERIKKQNQK